MREGAPNLREKRRKGSTTSDEDDKYTSSEASIKACKTETVSSPSSTFDRLSSTRGGRQGTDIKERAQRDDLSERGSNDASGKREENIIIRPSAALLRRSRVDPFSVDTLSAQDREYYLHDFFPPDPVFYQCESKQQTAICPQPYRQPDDSAEGDSSGPWAQIAKV